MAVLTPALQMVSSAAWLVLFGASVTAGLRVTSFRPALITPILPAKPVCTVNRREPEAVLPVCCAGAVMDSPSLACTGLTTLCVASLQVSLPKFQTFLTAVVPVSCRVKLLVSPAFKVSDAGVTVAVKPGTEAVAV